MKETYKQKEETYPTDTLIIAIKTGKCDICKTRKKILLLRYGFNLCEDCLDICTCILEQLNSEAPKEIGLSPKHPIPKADATKTQQLQKTEESA
jgi:hypothetical protein